VIRKRLGRFATIFTAASLALMVMGAGSVSAKNPTWTISVNRLPTSVAAGNDAGYFVTVENAGTSNVNAVTLTVTPSATPNATPTYFPGLTWLVGGPEVSCTSSGKLVCDLGTFEAGEKFTFTVAYHVPTGTTGSFDTTFSLQSASGNTGSDGGTGNHSRGDALIVTSSTGVNASQNFDAGFVVDDLSYSTTGSLGRNNKQTSSVDVTDTHLTVTVADGNEATTPTCDIAACNGAFGEWTTVSVPGNTNLIKVTLNIWGGSVPGGVTTDGIYLIHVPDVGPIQVIGDDASERCTPATGIPTNPQCVTVTKIGSNYRIVGWLFANGSIRGGF